MGPTALLPLQRKACLRIFNALKNPSPLIRNELVTLESRVKHATTRPPRVIIKDITLYNPTSEFKFQSLQTLMSETYNSSTACITEVGMTLLYMCSAQYHNKKIFLHYMHSMSIVYITMQQTQLPPRNFLTSQVSASQGRWSCSLFSWCHYFPLNMRFRNCHKKCKLCWITFTTLVSVSKKLSLLRPALFRTWSLPCIRGHKWSSAVPLATKYWIRTLSSWPIRWARSSAWVRI
jgi:hypothetical protein